ncbi:cellulase family glycosylhydrolase [Caulobacter sp. Root655]|uniref:glycoside hydrolase family 5 protein n=1 Tax=Caulobacter sp. Root655 TaxID=1736578 RepID=UPI0012E3D7FA|nr:cellulase family glycosylhydrolase [Caulobacter sp. Root655]
MMTLIKVRPQADLFLDARGRQVMLRGVNLGGDSKTPYPDGGTQFPSDFSDHRQVSFIGRPFPLEDAEEHLARLAGWGFNVVRLLTTWEAVEHAGPGLYDEAYLDYFAEVCRRCGAHGLHVFVDFHQDVWSRMSGGDGAPGWTFEAVGLDFTRFPAAGAAHVMQAKFDYADPSDRQAAYPQMSWGSNYRLPANGIMWTLFWGGRTFTPDFRVDGANVQDFLQGRYLGAIDAVARRLKALPNVLGFDTLNEPGLGWLGQGLSYRHLAPTAQDPTPPRVGPALSPLDSLAVARGIATTVPLLARNANTGAAEPSGETTVNPDGVSIWTRGAECPFERHGIYRVEGGRPVAAAEDVFRRHAGRALDIPNDAFGPLFRKVAETTRRHEPDWAVFAELDPFGTAFGRTFPDDMPERSVNASHWYDVAILFQKTVDPDPTPTPSETLAAPDRRQDRYLRQLSHYATLSRRIVGGAPTLIGEFGIPFDLDEGEAYAHWASGRRDRAIWSPHVRALSAMYDALDALLLHATQWNYTASNRNSLRVGDGWNQEDLSIFSADQRDAPEDRDSGGRAVEGFCRPFARAVQGRIGGMGFQREQRAFHLRFDADPTIDAPTEIYAPRVQYPAGFDVLAKGARVRLESQPTGQRLLVHALEPGCVDLMLKPSSRP